MVSNLQIDIGNSFCKWRLILKDDKYLYGSMSIKQINLMELDNAKEILADGFFEVGKEKVKSINICSVASEGVNRLISAYLHEELGVKANFVNVVAAVSGLTNSYEDPKKMGADRWLASLAAIKIYPNTELCIVDCGSATNVEFISKNGVHLGGYIIPGLYMMQQSILVSTSRVKSNEEKASIELGKNTSSSVSNGSYYITLSLFEKLQREMESKKGQLIITGGGAGFFKKHIKGHNVAYLPYLVFDGFEYV